MRFLIDADLPRPTAGMLRDLAHEAVDVRDIGLGPAPDEVIARYAQDHGLCILTGDFGFADVRNYPPEQYAGIVVFQLPPDATRQVILNQIRSFAERAEILDRLSGRLAIVEPSRFRLRAV